MNDPLEESAPLKGSTPLDNAEPVDNYVLLTESAQALNNSVTLKESEPLGSSQHFEESSQAGRSVELAGSPLDDPLQSPDSQAKCSSTPLSQNSDSSYRSADSRETALKDFGALALAYFLFRMPWIFMLPMSEAPDEFAHYWVIKYLREHWALPTAHDVFAGGASAVYGSLPQLGYIPHVLCGSFLPVDCLPLAERFGSTLMGAVMLFSAYKIGAILFPKNRLAALAIPAAIAVHPQLVFIHSYANSDSTSSALASVLIWLMLETTGKGMTFKRTVLMGALVGWVAITKYSGLAIIPIVGLAMIASIFIHGTSLALAAGSIASAGVLAIVLCAWWFIQNGKQYPNDFMGTKTMYNSWAATFHREQHYYLPPSHIIKSLRWWRMTFFSFWGLFGYMTKYLWRPVYFVYIGLVASAVLGGLNGCRLVFQNGFNQIKKDKETVIRISMWASLTLTIVVNLVSMIWASVYNLGGPQGRYLITSEIPIMALIIGGFGLLGGKLARGMTIGFIAFNVAVCIYSFIHLFQMYNGWHLNPLQ